MLANRIGVPAALMGAVVIACLTAQAATPDESPAIAPAAVETERHEAESLDSPAWRETLRSWNDWLATDNSFAPGELERLRQELDARLKGMSGSQLADFKRDLDAKLALLTGPTGREYRLWRNVTLSAASAEYGRRLRAHLPDFARMSAGEVQAVLDRFEYEQYRVQQHEAAYLRSQERRAAVVREELRQQRGASERALDRVGRDANLQAHFAVPPQQQPTIRQYRGLRGYGFPFFWFFWW